MYVSTWFVSVLVTVALYTSSVVRHAPFRGQLGLSPWQLQPGGGAGAMFLFAIFEFCLPRMVFMFGMQRYDTLTVFLLINLCRM